MTWDICMCIIRVAYLQKGVKINACSLIQLQVKINIIRIMFSITL